MYTQCSLTRKNSTIVSWIPSKFAKIGQILKLKDEYDEWTDGWEVRGVGSSMEDPPDSHNAIKVHRKRTGDSLPK